MSEAYYTQREQQRIMAKTLEQLKPLDWKIFIAYYYKYKKVEEIAQEFQMNPQTVKTDCGVVEGCLKNSY